MTMQGARLVIFCETLPSSNPARRPRPRRPMTTRSAFSRCAISIITWAGSPEPARSLIFAAPTCVARFFAWLSTWLERSSSASPISPSIRPSFFSFLTRKVTAHGEDAKFRPGNLHQLSRSNDGAIRPARTRQFPRESSALCFPKIITKT